MDVGDWLRNLGLGQYQHIFRDNGVDGAVLPKLTVDDLKEMGVAGVGHRRKIIAAIEEPNASSAVTTQTVKPASTTSPASVPQPTDAAERRQLTVMFCDLVGSTAMSARLDPEDMREIIGAYHDCCASYIDRDGGFVAKYMGDGVLAYFGYPQAHEHDAERAVHAGLAIVEAAPKRVTAAGSPLRVRVGIATAGRRRRPHRIGGVAGARRCRRDAEPRGALAVDRGARHGRHRRGDAQVAREPVRAPGPRSQRA
jgi:hypothetical protein